MNTQLNGDQSDIKAGAIALKATADLTGKENLLVKIASSSGAKFALPSAFSDPALFILMSGDIAANDNWAEIPSTNENARVKLKGTCNPGDRLALYDPTASSGAYAGMVATLPSTEGKYWTIGVAEEAGADGQLVKFRFDPKFVHVGTAFSGSTPASTGVTQTTPYGFSTAAQGDAVVATVREMRAFMAAQGWKT